MLREAIKLGYGLRIGFVDTMHLSDGSVAHSYGELVVDDVKLIHEYNEH